MEMLKTMQENANANQAEMKADRKAYQEKVDADRKAFKEKMDALIANIKIDREETTACMMKWRPV
jgi:ribosomal protein L11 methylase PrmA